MLNELHLTQTEAEDLLVLYRCIFPIARILKEDEVNGKCALSGEIIPCKCYELWNKGEPCSHCISMDTLKTKKDGAKLGFVKDRVYQVISKYCTIDGKPAVIELAKLLESNTFIDLEAYNFLLDANIESETRLYTDPLTTAYNRLFYENHKNDVVHKTGIAMIDVDNFKMCNDIFGHKYGDQVLVEVVKTIKKNIRSNDVIIRIGGDEFVLIVDNISEENFKVKLEKIKKDVKDACIIHGNHTNFTLSIGALVGEDITLASAVDKADKLMYKAKEANDKVVTSWDKDVANVEIKHAKPLILVVDDALLNRFTLMELLKDDFDLIEAEDGKVALSLVEEYNLNISAILLDINMPNMNGYELLDILNRRGFLSDIPVIMISGEQGYEAIMKCYNLGASDFVSRPFVASIVKKRVDNIVKLYEKQRKYKSNIKEQIDDNNKISLMMTSVLSHIVGYRNGESGPHVMHVESITEILLNELTFISDKYNLSKEDKKNIVNASALHDIGKIGVDEKILNKPGKLTNEEFDQMKKHTTIGASMIDNLEEFKDEPFIHYVHDICRWHHEKWDGRGYPDHLKGDEIPIWAQVVAVADCYDALVSPRVYKPAFSHEQAINMIINGECGQFNPLLMEVLKSCEKRLKNIREYSVV